MERTNDESNFTSNCGNSDSKSITDVNKQLMSSYEVYNNVLIKRYKSEVENLQMND